MKKILVTGATGAMGKPLIRYLSDNPEFEVYATSRSDRKGDRIQWIRGNARDKAFLEELLKRNSFDAVIDYMVYATQDFRDRYEFILDHTGQYVFTSSARVYAETEEEIDENAPRILDVCDDHTYLAHDTYDLAKARQEDLLMQSGRKNWTIVRPSLTYNSRRMQFTIFELEEWVYRALDHNSIIFPAEMRDVVATMTHGNDVAKIVSQLVLNRAAIGEVFNVNGGGHRTWGEILDVYRTAIESSMGCPTKVAEVYGVENITKHLNRYDQYRLARGISRRFSNAKVESVIGPFEYISIENGLSDCMRAYLENPERIYLPARRGAYLDRLVGEKTPLNRFKTPKQKLGYVLGRAGLIKV